MTENRHVKGSYWLETAPGGPRPPLTEDLDVDVAVIGAGIAGLSTAWELTQAGRRVAVLEAGQVAGGVSGHTTAKLTALYTLIYDKLRRTRGPDRMRGGRGRAPTRRRKAGCRTRGRTSAFPAGATTVGRSGS